MGARRRAQLGHFGSAIVAVLCLAAIAGPALAAECAGVSFPERVRVDGRTLVLNGLGLREATLLAIDVYVAGLYLPARVGNAREILATDGPRQMRLQLLRDVSAADMASSLASGFRRAAGDSFPRHAESLRSLVAAIPPLAAGDRFTLTQLPGRGVRIAHGERALLALPDADFARILFAIWLGETPLSAKLKASLLGAPCAG